MVAPPEIPRNAQQGKALAAPKRRPSAAKRIIRAEVPQDTGQRRMVRVFYSPSSSSKRLEYSTRRCPRWWHLHKLWGGAIGYPHNGGRAGPLCARLNQCKRGGCRRRDRATPNKEKPGKRTMVVLPGSRPLYCANLTPPDLPGGRNRYY
jgi:hypothetical protein